MPHLRYSQDTSAIKKQHFPRRRLTIVSTELNQCRVASLKFTVPRQRSRSRNRDPYEHLTIFQRDIILYISNAVESMDRSKQVNGVNIRDIVRGLRTKYGARLNEREIG